MSDIYRSFHINDYPKYKISRIIRKPAFCICKNKGSDIPEIVQSLYFLNPKFQAASHLLRLYRPVCVGPGQKRESRLSHCHTAAQILFNVSGFVLKKDQKKGDIEEKISIEELVEKEVILMIRPNMWPNRVR